MNTKRLLALMGVGALWSSAAAMAGCSSDDTTPTTAADAGRDATTTAEGGTHSDASPVTDGAPTDSTVTDAPVVVTEAGPDVVVATDAGSDAPVSTLYTRLGGHAGIRAAINAIVADEVADPQIASYFYAQVTNPVADTVPTVGEIEECFTDLLGSNAQGSEVYPTTVSTVVTDAGTATVTVPLDGGAILTDAGHATWLCRDMTAIHAHLHISGGTFDRFVAIAAARLALPPFNVAPNDIATIGSVLVGTRTAIVDPTMPEGGVQCFPGPTADGGPAPACVVDSGTGPTDAGGQ